MRSLVFYLPWLAVGFLPGCAERAREHASAPETPAAPAASPIPPLPASPPFPTPPPPVASPPPRQVAGLDVPLSYEQARRTWSNETYRTTIHWINGDEWTEFDIGSTKPRLTYRELQRSADFVELFCNERNQHLRIFNRRAELFKNNRWEWVANGSWQDMPGQASGFPVERPANLGTRQTAPPAARSTNSAPPPAAAATLSVADLVANVEPAVVYIEASSERKAWLGTGYIVKASGVAVTNFHVVDGALSGTAKFTSGEETPITGVLRSDPLRDIAVIQLGRSSGLRVLPVADQLPRKGEDVCAFGCPLGLAFSVSEGLVSSIRDGKEVFGTAGTWVQTTAPISHGNSGGPLVDRSGRVVAMNTSCREDGQNINFAISCVDIRDMLSQAESASVQSLAEHARSTQAHTRRKSKSSGGRQSPHKETEDPRVLEELEKLARDRDQRAEKIATLVEHINQQRASALKSAILSADQREELRARQAIGKMRTSLRAFLQPAVSYNSLDCERLTAGAVGKLHNTTFLVLKVADTEAGICLAAPMNKLSKLRKPLLLAGVDLHSTADEERLVPPASAIFLSVGVEAIGSKRGSSVALHVIRQIADLRDFAIEEPAIDEEPEFSDEERSRYATLLAKRAEKREQRVGNEKREKAAQSKLAAAKQLIKLGKPTAARELLGEIMSEYSETDAAVEAEQVLADLMS